MVALRSTQRRWLRLLAFLTLWGAKRNFWEGMKIKYTEILVLYRVGEFVCKETLLSSFDVPERGFVETTNFLEPAYDNKEINC
jgi:hypothetical protein